jgi:NADH dehydrogenase
MHLDESLSKATLNALGKKGVTVRFGQKVRGYDGQQVELEKGEPINTKTIIWTAGVRTAGLIDSLNLDKAAQNQVRVLPTLQLPQYPQVFVIGDAAYFEDQDGKALPMVAQVAIQQAERAAENLKNMLNNQPLEPFKYKDLGSMTTIGHNQAVAEISRFKFQGFLAWLIWLFVHLMQLVGFRNRVVVFINWVWEYITYERAARLIERE